MVLGIIALFASEHNGRNEYMVIVLLIMPLTGTIGSPLLHTT